MALTCDDYGPGNRGRCCTSLPIRWVSYLLLDACNPSRIGIGDEILGATGVRPVFFYCPVPATGSFGFAVSRIGKATCSNHYPVFFPPCSFVRIGSSNHTPKIVKNPPVVFILKRLTIIRTSSRSANTFRRSECSRIPVGVCPRTCGRP